MYSAWARRKRNRFTTAVLLVVLLALIGVYVVFTSAPATCSDGTQNQNEEGIDCGGVCTRVCSENVQDIRLEWVRGFAVTDGWWSAMAYLQNPNADMQTDSVQYRIRLYDDAGFVIAEKVDETYVYDEVVLPLYWGRIFLPEDKNVFRATFELLQEPEWHRIDTAPRQVTIKQQTITERNNAPEVRAIIENNEHIALQDIYAVAIVYDNTQNAMAVSQTYLQTLGARAQTPISFVWQEQFPRPVSRVEIVPRIPQAL
jgi:hypothetical protein